LLPLILILVGIYLLLIRPRTKRRRERRRLLAELKPGNEVERFQLDKGPSGGGEHKFLPEKILRKVREILTRDEEIICAAAEIKAIGTPECLIFTNRRFIACLPRSFGRFDLQDYIWRDLENVTISEKLLGAVLSLMTIDGMCVQIEHLDKSEARRLYSIAKEMEERVREERRVRGLEEARAAAGGITLQQMGSQAMQQGVLATEHDPVARLQKLKEMFDTGLITAGEYEAKRAEIISKM
jgi:hypothetical protein